MVPSRAGPRIIRAPDRPVAALGGGIQGVTRPMNISPSTLLVVAVVTAVINVLIVLALVARSRTGRARHVVELDGIISSSYVDPESTETRQPPFEEWEAAGGWPGSMARLADARSAWPGIAFGASMPTSTERQQAADAVEAEVEPEVEPFEYPAPTSLEQRSLGLDDDPVDDDAADAHADETEDEGDVVDELEDGAEDTTEAVADDQVGTVVDEEVEAAPVLTALPTMAAPSAPRGRDALTGMLDAMSFEEALSHEDAREQRYRRSATVIVFELDGLAKIVDRLGSEPGDRIEAALGDTITRLARRADYVARLERGRYAALLPETDEVAAINYVERIRRACDLWLESGAIAMRLAIGWASTGGDATLDGALRLATDRMRMESRRNSRLAGDATEMPADEEASGL
jgi:diguanylate cyclase (GGDEF)-like protein